MLDMHCRPSDLIGINDSYAAFCFDEACAYIISKMNNDEEPKVKQNKDKHILKPSDLYSKYE